MAFSTKKTLSVFYLLSWALLSGNINTAQAQSRQLETKVSNYSAFRQPMTLVNEEVIRYNSGYEAHPELGLLYAGAPCTDCYEVIEKRTETTKTFAALGTKGRRIWIQSSSDPMHYKNEQGAWLTIQPELAATPGQTGIFSTLASPWPVTINTHVGYAQIGTPGQRVSFNRQLELIFIAADGTERSLGKADWRNYSAGDDGMYVKDIWSGIDMEIMVFRGATKTNFVVKRPMPQYANGKLAIRDHMKMDEGLSIHRTGGTQWTGPFEIKHVSGQLQYNIGGAVAYAQKDPANTFSTLPYRIEEKNQLDIVVPGYLLNSAAAWYPLVIDPFLQASNAIPIINGSGYVPACNSLTGGCTSINPVPIPPHTTVTEMWAVFQFLATNGALINHGAFDFKVGNCRNPDLPIGNWTCAAPTLPNQTLCGGNLVAIFDGIDLCMPAPTCMPYDLDVTFRFLRCYGPGTGCNITYTQPTMPLTITAGGWTLEPFTIDVSAPNATICEGDSTVLNASPKYGVRPFQYLWTPTGSTDSAITVKPTVNTIYTVQFTDSCGRVAHDTVEVFVTPSDNPGFTFAPDSVCPNTPIAIKGNEPGLPSYYSWSVPGSAHPTLNGSKEFTTTYSEGGVYDIIMFYQSGNCKFPDTMQITIHPEVNVEMYDTICDGESYEFYGSHYTQTGTYRHLHQTNYGCDSILILHLVVNPIPPVPVASANTPLCYGDDLILKAAEISGASYEWTGPRGFTSRDRETGIQDVNFDMSGSYFVTSTKLNCTSPPGEVAVEVKPLPEIRLHADRTEICSGDSVRLETVQDPIYRYQWRPDYYMVTNDAAIAYAVVGYKTYIHLTVIDTGNCVSKDSIYINTEPCCDVFLPDAFTPNGDGKNDAFRVVTDGNLSLSVFRIVNRWGMTVFATGDQHLGWDGLYNGRPQDPGTYHYYLKYGCPDGGTYEKKGSLVLIR